MGHRTNKSADGVSRSARTERASGRCGQEEKGLARDKSMRIFRSAVHFSFDAAAALFYAGAIAIVLAAVAVIFTQMLTFGLVIAALSFVCVSVFWTRTLWRRYRATSLSDNQRLLAH